MLLSLINQAAPSTLPPQCHEWILVVLGSYNCMYTYTSHGSCIVLHVGCVWNFSKVFHMSGSALDHGLASKLIRNVFVDGNTGSAAILKCSGIKVHDE
jgi:hypothetical protein